MSTNVPTWLEIRDQLNASDDPGLETALAIAKILGKVPAYAQLHQDFPRDPEAGDPQWDNGVPVSRSQQKPGDPPWEGGFFPDYVSSEKAAMDVVPEGCPIRIEISGDRRTITASVQAFGTWFTSKPVAETQALAICRAGVLARVGMA